MIHKEHQTYRDHDDPDKAKHPKVMVAGGGEGTGAVAEFGAEGTKHPSPRLV